MKKIFTLIAMMLVGTVSTFAQDTYTVAGVSDIVNGASWDQTNAENDMTEVETGIYQLVVTGCKLEAGRDYNYKVVKNHSWAESWPADNAVLTVEETAEYTVTFEFDEEWQDVSATAEKTGEYVVDPDAKTWTVAGSSVPLFGTSWDPANADNDMTKQSDGTFKLVKKAVELGKGTIQYKVAANHDWGEAYPSSNASFAIPEDGTYDVTFTFNPTTHAVSATPEKTGSAVIEHTWTIAGGVAGADSGETTLFGPFWDAACADNDMTEQSDGTWTLVKENVQLDAETYAFKACFDHSFELSYGDPETTDGNALLEIKRAGEYNVTFTLDLTEGAEKVSAVATNLSGDSTGIDELNNEQPATVYYNLQGIQTNRLQRGLYITNGKKVVVK